MISISVKTQIDSAKLAGAVKNDSQLWLFAASEWHKLYQPYVPWRVGDLAQHVTLEPGQITHIAPYAKKCYEGNFNFRKDKHPLATARWDEAAIPTQLPKLTKALQAYVNSGRLKI